MKKISRIEVQFPCDVAVEDDIQKVIDECLTEICRRYKKANPGRTMWVFGVGAKMLSNPFMVEDGEPLQFDDSVLHFEIAEREKHQGEDESRATAAASQHYGLPDNTRRADRVKIGVCEEGHIHISLLDAGGEPFADACVGGVADSRAFSLSFQKALNDIEAQFRKGLQ